MAVDSWKITIRDNIDSPPFIVVGDLLVVVRSPRSRDFVTVEIGTVPEEMKKSSVSREGEVVCSSRPAPIISPAWCGEVYVGDDQAVEFELHDQQYRLILKHIDDSSWPPPYASYDFVLRRRKTKQPSSVAIT